MSRDGTRLLEGADSARQRLRDALAIERGSYPFARDYGSLLGDLVDRNVDSAYEARVYAGVADAIAHPPNGLDDIALQEIRLYQGPGLVEAQVFAEWLGDTGERTPIGVRQMLVASQPPIAHAGDDQAVAAGASVTLDGSASADPDGNIARYLWEQTGGSTVALSDAAAAMPTFDAPRPAAAQTLTFRLVVTDDRDAQSTDYVQVAVAPPVRTLVIGDLNIGWDGLLGPIDPALVAGGGVAYLRHVALSGTSPIIRLSSAPGIDPAAAGPELTDAWERSPRAMTITAGLLSFAIPGPAHPDSVFADPTEPYFWTPPLTSAYTAFRVAYLSLSTTVTALTTLTLDDGA